MTRQEIEKAAEQNISCDSPLDLGAILEGVGRESFVVGAEWRINSVWHDRNEEADTTQDLLLMFDDKNCMIVSWKDTWANLLYVNMFSKWAYIKDLIQNND